MDLILNIRFKKKSEIFDVAITAIGGAVSVGTVLYGVWYLGLHEPIDSHLFYIWHSGNPLEKICEIDHNRIKMLRLQNQANERERMVDQKERNYLRWKNAFFANSKALIQDHLILSVLRQRTVNAGFTASWTVSWSRTPAAFLWEKALSEAWSEAAHSLLAHWLEAAPPADWQFMDRKDKPELLRFSWLTERRLFRWIGKDAEAFCIIAA